MHFHRLYHLIAWELKLQANIHNFYRYICAFLFLCTISLVFVVEYSDIGRLGGVFFIVALPLSMISLTSMLFKVDISDSHLESLLVGFDAAEIVLAKFVGLLVNAIVAAALNLPVIFIIFGLKGQQILTMSMVVVLLVLAVCALLILSGAIQGYFRGNTNIISLVVMPLLIPSIILSGLAWQSADNAHLLLMMLGIDCIFVPASLMFSTLLIEGIYDLG